MEKHYGKRSRDNRNSTALFYHLTSYSRPSNFEKVIQALIFTLLIQALEIVGKPYFVGTEKLWSTEAWDKSASFIFSVSAGIVLGIVFSFFANNDFIHRILRYIKITRETSFPSEWFGSFLVKRTWVVLHFHDERRLYGWPTEWPSEPTKGHFLINNPAWIDEKGEEKEIKGVSNILINVESVKWVEFLRKNQEGKNG